MDRIDLPPPRFTLEEAQQTSVIVIPSFLSLEEVSAIQAVAASLRPRCGALSRTFDQADGTPTWSKVFLSTDGLFQKVLPDLHTKLVDCALELNRNVFHLFSEDVEANTRVVEYHEVLPGGHLSRRDHYDSGSLLTIDVMLSEPNSDFEGGAFVADDPESSGLDPCPVFQNCGDVAVFVSHKYHSVDPVTRGKRNVLVIELWEGEERHCGHRCECQKGNCGVLSSGSAEYLQVDMSDDELKEAMQQAFMEADNDCVRARM